MSTIGLYDIDLWHAAKSNPNLELMKTYNYLYNQGHKVIMIKPTDNLGRFNQIIYFKDSLKLKIPKDIDIIGDKKSFYGYGFYGYMPPLNKDVFNVPPVYEPYDAFTTKLSINNYNKLKRNSLIRFETKDFTDLKSDCKMIYFADHNPLYIDGIYDFMYEYKNKDFYFFFFFLAKDEKTAEKFLRYSNLIKNYIIMTGNYTEDFFYENCNDNIIFDFNKKEYEDLNNHYLKIIKIILWYKKNNIYKKVNMKFYNKFDKYIYDWFNIKNNLSFFEFYKNNNIVLKELSNTNSEIRSLLKTNPEKITKENLKLRINLIY